MTKFQKDVAERVAWTAAQAAVASVAVSVAELDYAWVPVVAAVLAVAKGFLARKVGDPESAGTLHA